MRNSPRRPRLTTAVGTLNLFADATMAVNACSGYDSVPDDAGSCVPVASATEAVSFARMDLEQTSPSGTDHYPVRNSGESCATPRSGYRCGSASGAARPGPPSRSRTPCYSWWRAPTTRRAMRASRSKTPSRPAPQAPRSCTSGHSSDAVITIPDRSVRGVSVGRARLMTASVRIARLPKVVRR